MYNKQHLSKVYGVILCLLVLFFQGKMLIIALGPAGELAASFQQENKEGVLTSPEAKKACSVSHIIFVL